MSRKTTLQSQVRILWWSSSDAMAVTFRPASASRRRGVGSRVTFEATLGGAQGAGEVDGFARWGYALAFEGAFVPRLAAAEDADDVFFPVHRFVAGIGGVERRLFVGIAGIVLAEDVE